MKYNIQRIMTVTAIIITLIVAFLVVPPEARQGKFYTALIFLFVAELLLLGYPLRYKRSDLPFVLSGLFVVAPVYFIGVCAIVFTGAVTALVFPVLLAMQLIWFLLLFIIGSLLVVSGQHAVVVDYNFQESRQPFIEIRNRFQLLCDRINKVNRDELMDAKAAFIRQNDELRYQVTDTIAETVEMTSALSIMLDAMEQGIAVCAMADAGTDIETLKTDLMRLLKEFEEKLKYRSILNLQSKR